MAQKIRRVYAWCIKVRKKAVENPGKEEPKPVKSRKMQKKYIEEMHKYS